MKIHAISQVMPAMAGAEYEDLKQSIKEHGLLQPITMYEGSILDGRNREKACRELGIKPETVEFSGDNPLAFVLSMNVHRRHLDASQRAMIASKVATLRDGQRKAGVHNCTAQTIPEAAEALNVSTRTVKQARKVQTAGVSELVRGVETGEVAVSEAAQIASLEAEDQYEVLGCQSKKERKQKTRQKQEKATAKKKEQTDDEPFALNGKTAKLIEPYYTLESWAKLGKLEREKIIAAGFESKAKMNKQDSTSIEWARHSLNTVTGCKHDCPYCYARDMAERLLKQGFAPSFYPARLSAPSNHTMSDEAGSDPSHKNIFANSMSDLFGKWVPADWITATIEMARRNAEWNFLVLTKFPQRATEFEYPDNWWLGATIDAQARVSPTEKAFADIRCKTKWLSCEPLLEPLTFSDMSLFQWVVIGGASRSNRTPEWNPPFDWLARLYVQARDAGCLIYHKENCGLTTEMRIKEFPWAENKLKVLPKAFQYLKGMK